MHCGSTTPENWVTNNMRAWASARLYGGSSLPQACRSAIQPQDRTSWTLGSNRRCARRALKAAARLPAKAGTPTKSPVYGAESRLQAEVLDGLQPVAGSIPIRDG
jgi:hypothetical protein